MKKYSFIFRERGMGVLFVDLLLRDYGIHDFVFIGDKVSFEGFASTEEIRQASEYGFNLCSDSKKIDRLEKKVKDNCSVYLDVLNHIDKIDYRILSNKQLIALFEKFCKISKDNVDIYFLTESHFLEKVEEQIKKSILEKCVDKEVANKYIVHLTTPVAAQNILNLEKIEWAKLIKKNSSKDAADIEKDIIDHYTKFIFLFIDKDTDYLHKKFKKMSFWRKEKIDRIEEEILRIDGNMEKNRRIAIEKLAVDRQTLILCESVRKTAMLRLNLRFFMNTDFLFEKILKEISRRSYLALNQTNNCLISEIRAILNNKKINLTEINKRNEKFVAVKSDKQWTFYTGEKSAKIAEKVMPVIDKSILCFSGNIANTGKYLGKVRVLKNIENEEDLDEKIHNMKKGEVLVTEMTRPQLIGACKMASAIITDEGGINCHASIISRELNIPCIVGTKIATQVLRDGDMVDVDADCGIIKIISKYIG